MSSDPQDFDARLATALAAIEQTRRKGLLWLAGLASAVVVVIAVLQILGAEDASLIPLLLGAILFAPMIFGWTRKSHKDVVIPLLAEQLDLRFSAPGAELAALVPPLVLPDQEFACDDMVRGSLAGRDVWLADVIVSEKSGDKDRIFKGFVLSLDQIARGADLFISDKHYAQVWPKPDESLQRLSEIAASHRRRYTVWTSRATSTPDEETLNALIDLEDMFGIGSRLAILRCADGRLTLAVRQSDALFQIGGLLRTPARIRADMAAALARLSLPLQVAAAILELEPRLLPKPATEKSSPDA